MVYGLFQSKQLQVQAVSLAYFIILLQPLQMEYSDFRKTTLWNSKNTTKYYKQQKFNYSKSQPAEFPPKPTLKVNLQIVQQLLTPTTKRIKSHSFAHNKQSHNLSQELKTSCETGGSPQQLDLLNKAIIHDTFSNYLSTNYKTFRIGVNTVAIKKKFKFEKDGLGQLACNLAKPKPINHKERTEPESNQQKLYLRELYREEMRARNKSTELNHWAKKLQLLQNNQNTRVNLKSKTEELPVLSSKKKAKPKVELFKPWAQFDESFAHKKYPGAIRSAFDLYDIIE